MPSDINFDCPQCGQNLDAPEEMRGLFIECPACNKIIKIPGRHDTDRQGPAAASPPSPPEPAPQEMKSSTMRIQLPSNLGIPEPRQRRIFIKRPHA